MLASTSARRGPIVRRAAPLVAAQREMLLECGDGVRLQCFRSSPRRGHGMPVVLLHGWEGSAESLYVLSLGQQLFEQGFDVLRLNLRDHGATHHLNRELFHSCLLPEVVGAMRALQATLGRPLRLVGFSLGGNFMLRVGADSLAPDAVAAVVAVSPVLDPEATLRALEGGLSLYTRYFVKRWTRSLRAKQKAWPDERDYEPLLRSQDLRRMTADLVQHCTDFGSLQAYLAGYAVTGLRLAALRVPARIVLSADDPIIPAADLSLLARSDQLRIVRTRYGGHCGFVDSLSSASFADRYMLEEFEQIDFATADNGARR